MWLLCHWLILGFILFSLNRSLSGFFLILIRFRFFLLFLCKLFLSANLSRQLAVLLFSDFFPFFLLRYIQKSFWNIYLSWDNLSYSCFCSFSPVEFLSCFHLSRYCGLSAAYSYKHSVFHLLPAYFHKPCFLIYSLLVLYKLCFSIFLFFYRLRFSLISQFLFLF